MAGRIKSSDVEEVKRRTNIADVVSDHVMLKNAGIDSMKGLCPFHDERSPSFHVRPNLGYYHCFGCGESGDSISFIQNMDHLSFAEAVERLAARINYVLTYEEGNERREDGPNRARLLAANTAAAAFFQSQLSSDEATTARIFLNDRGFEETACQEFGVGYAPKGWDALTKHLSAAGFQTAELVHAGLVSEGQRGVYDRFRGRIVWPIRDTSGQTVGFGARKLYDDDTGPKYLNTSETPVYHKSRILYGLDLAKKTISRTHRVVVVEGYTDVMACHLAGETSAVATCGTAFGKEHISVLRRMMGDDTSAEVIFTFDPDEAGQKAALRAFSDEKMFSAQTYVAVAPDGLDPADLRLHRGDAAVLEMFTKKVPLFEFALRQALAKFNLNSVEGRVAGLRAAAPIVAEIKDQGLRPGYTRELARMLGLELAEVQNAVKAQLARSRATAKTPQAAQNRGRDVPHVFEQNPHIGAGSPEPDAAEFTPARRMSLSQLPMNPSTRLERDALMAVLQRGPDIGMDLLLHMVTAEFSEPSLLLVRNAIAASLDELHTEPWFESVVNHAPEQVHELIRELAFAPLPVPAHKQALLGTYARGVVIGLLDRDLLSLKSELVSRMLRIGDPLDAGSRRIQEQLAALETARRALRND